AQVRVFYQVWARPLMTLNKQHLISDAMQICGATNVFADAPTLVPRVDPEAVLAAKPQVIATSVAGGKSAGKSDGLEPWLKFTTLPAVRDQHFVVLDADQITRPTPDILDAVQALCEGIDRARQ
ncbi:MAG: cobalamin-binding protein, partial [Burkholderiaceae bacterium]